MSEQTPNGAAPAAPQQQKAAPADPTAPNTSAQMEAAQRAAFDRAMARQRAAGEPATSAERDQKPRTPPEDVDPDDLLSGDESPRGARKPEGEPKPADKAEDAAGDDEGDEGLDSDDPFASMTPSQYRAHLEDRKVLKRDGLDDDDIDELIARRGLDAFAQRAARRREHHRETDRAFSGGAQGGRREDGRATDAEPARQPDHPQQSARDAFRPLMDDLGLDGAEAERFTRTLRSELHRMTQEAIHAELKPVREATERHALDALHGQYREMVPNVADWVAVEDMARDLVAAGRYATVPDAIARSIQLVTGKDPARATSGDGQARDPESGQFIGQQRRRNGAVRKPSRSRRSTEHMTPEQREFAAFKASSAGDHKLFHELTGEMPNALRRRMK